MVRLTLILLISLYSILSYGAIGKITEHEKEPASIVRNNGKLEGKKGTELEMNDAIHTGKSVVGITFDDDTKVNITENSKLVIDDFVYEPKKGAGKLGMKVAMGTVRYTSGIIAHKNPNAVDIKTPTSTIAVRGTDFLMSVDEIGRSLVILLPQCDAIGCTTGVIDVMTTVGVVTLNQANQATMVDTGYDPPSPPVILNLEGRQLNNTLQVSQPKTTSGAPVQQKETKKESTTEQQVAVVSQQEEQKKEVKNVIIVEEEDPVYTESKSSRVFPVFEKSVQVAWMYKGYIDGKKEYSNVIVPKQSDVVLTVIQDYVPDVYVFGKGIGGMILINQTIK